MKQKRPPSLSLSIHLLHGCECSLNVVKSFYYLPRVCSSPSPSLPQRMKEREREREREQKVTTSHTCVSAYFEADTFSRRPQRTQLQQHSRISEMLLSMFPRHWRFGPQSPSSVHRFQLISINSSSSKSEFLPSLSSSSTSVDRHCHFCGSNSFFR